MHTPVSQPAAGTILDITLAAAARDLRTTDEARKEIVPLLDGMSFHESTRISDDRGSLVEMIDPRSGWHPDPIVYAYSFTIRPGAVKGWALHKLHEDRYFVMSGVMEVVLYDPRPESSTYGKVCKVYLSGDRPRMVNVPKFVWHADHNVGDVDMVAVNFPTTPYDHANPDKYRLPIDTDLIPYDFGDAKGW